MAATGKQRKKNEKSLANLKPFPKGKSGNPSGRPKGSLNIWNRVRRKLRERVANGDGKRYADQVAETFVAALLDGKWPQTKELLDREEGPPGDVTRSPQVIVQVVYRDAPATEDANGRITHHPN